MSVLEWILIIVLLVVGVPFTSYICGFIFGKGFISGIAEYFNKLKANKNEQKENK